MKGSNVCAHFEAIKILMPEFYDFNVPKVMMSRWRHRTWPKFIHILSSISLWFSWTYKNPFLNILSQSREKRILNPSCKKNQPNGRQLGVTKHSMNDSCLPEWIVLFRIIGCEWFVIQIPASLFEYISLCSIMPYPLSCI